MKTLFDLNTIPAELQLQFTGERFCPEIKGTIRYEHMHRYLYAERFVEKKAVLDVACGEGYGSYLLATRAHSVLGIDVDPSTVGHAKRRYPSDRIKFVAGSLARLPAEDNSIDVAVCFETIEHVTDQLGSLAELRRVLRPDGVLLISTPNAEIDDGAWHSGNPYHTHELGHAEFVALLERHFPKIQLLVQRSTHGSVILPAEMPSSAGGHTATAESASTFATKDGIEASYFIAIASAMDVPGVVASLYDDSQELNSDQAEFRYAVARMHALEQELQHERASVASRDILRGEELEFERARIIALEARITAETELRAGQDEVQRNLTTTNVLLKIQIDHLRTKLRSVGAQDTRAV